MYLTDYHTHSILSPDGSVPLSAMADAALAAGLSELCITDHCDQMNSRGGFTPNYDWAPAVAQMLETRAVYSGKISLKLGLEYGVGHVNPAASERILSQPELDFVIGSVHNFSPAAGGIDFYFSDYTTPTQCHTAMDDYLTSMAALAETDFYDVLGHIVYPLRYMAQPIPLDGYMERIRAIIKTAATRGHGVEINTWRGRTIEAWRPVLQHLKDCGGDVVTVGSDAHTPDGVGKGVREAYALLTDMGFRYVTTFEHRKPVYHKL